MCILRNGVLGMDLIQFLGWWRLKWGYYWVSVGL